MRRATSRASIVFRGVLARGEQVDSLALVRDLGAVARETGGEWCRGRSARHGAHGNEMFRGREAPEIGFAEARGPADRRGEYLLECGERNPGQRHAAIDHAPRQLARHIVRLAERDRLRAHQGIGKLGEGNPGFVDVATHFGAVDGHRRQQSAEQRHQPVAGVERLVAGNLHFALGIVHVGERRVVHRRQHRFAARRAQRSHQTQMLHRYGVALLRHDRADLDESVGHMQVSDLEPGPCIQVLDEPPRVNEQQLDRGVYAGGVVGGGDAAVGILLHVGEAQQFGHALAVEPEARGGDRGRTHAAKVDGARGCSRRSISRSDSSMNAQDSGHRSWAARVVRAYRRRRWFRVRARPRPAMSRSSRHAR